MNGMTREGGRKPGGSRVTKAKGGDFPWRSIERGKDN